MPNISVEFTVEEGISLLVAGEAMVAAYERVNAINDEAYLRLKVACEKLTLELWEKEA